MNGAAIPAAGAATTKFRPDTIVGAQVNSPTSALIWCDSEVVGDAGRTKGFMAKMMIMPRARIASVATGSGPHLYAAEVVAEVAAMDQAIEEIPGVLVAASYRCAGLLLHGTALTCVCLVVGYSRALGRIAAYTFSPPEYRAVQVESFGLPEVPWQRDPTDLEDVAGIARQQFQELRRIRPGARGGLLRVAEVTPQGIVHHTLGDLAEGLAPAGEDDRTPETFAGRVRSRLLGRRIRTDNGR